MSNGNARIVGRFTSMLVKNHFTSQRRADAPSLRMVGFDRGEIVEFIESFDSFKLSGCEEPVRVVVAGKSWEGLPSRFQLEDGKTVTSYRNNNSSGLVIIELEEPRDAQGLRNMYTITDRLILPRADDRDGWRTLVSLAWGVNKNGDEGALPGQLADAVQETYRTVAPLGMLSLRKWASFIDSCCARLTMRGQAVDSNVIEQALGAELSNLDLFTDDELAVASSAADRRRRLVKNFNLSQKRNPKGKEVPDEELLRRIETTEFRGADGEVLAAGAQCSIRAAAHAIVDPARRRDYASVSYKTWLQLFESDAERDGLGAQVRSHLERDHRERVVEFDALGVDRGLDQEEPEAAEVMLKQGAELMRLLPHNLQHRVVRLATPAGTASEDPLRKLLEMIQAEREEPGAPQEQDLELVVENAPDAPASLSLFRFLFGPALRSVQKASADGLGWRLKCVGELEAASSIEFPSLARGEDGEDEPEFEAREYWLPLKFVLKAIEPNAERPKVLGRFEWRPLEQPGLVLLGRIFGLGADAPARLETEASFEFLLERALNPTLPLLGADELSPPDGCSASEWLAGRRAFIEGVRLTGLEKQALEAYVAAWEGWLQKTTEEHVPRGAPLPELDAFLDLDVASSNGSVVMLATHPLRVRWIAAHLRQLTDSLVIALGPGLRLNPVNDDLFFERIAGLSPHGHPPVLCARNQTLAVATREVGWHEEFAAIKRETTAAADWLSVVDDGSIDAMAHVVRQYLEAYPHKSDGLTVLVLLRDGNTRFVERLLSRIRQREHSTAQVELHVYAPLPNHFAIAQALARYDDEEERGTRLLPRVQTVLHVWKDTDVPPPLVAIERAIDIAIVPNLFSRAALALDETRPNVARPGKFDPWRDSPSYIARAPNAAARINVTRVLLPEAPDPLIERWSTLAVWRSRSKPVSEEGSANTDFVTLQVRFDKNAPFFDELHDIAQWVVTLDPFIGRQQIEALPKAPDVITVRPGVGKNGLYTLVVSSRAGRKFVIGRLARRLVEDFGSALPAPANDVATELYGIARHLAPGVVLRALGLGHTMQEILGLLLARKAVDEMFPAALADGFEAWVSLDEHTEWFGGPQSVRADLLRVVGRTENKKLVLEIDVLESKYRTQEDVGRSDEQVGRTIQLVRDALSLDELGAAAHDAAFWRREMLQAIDQSSRQAADGEAFSALRVVRAGTPSAGLEDDIREAFRSGDYELRRVRGIVCTIGVGSDIRGRVPEQKTNGGFEWVRIGRSDAVALFGGDVRAAVAGAVPPPIPAETRDGSLIVRGPVTSTPSTFDQDLGTAIATELSRRGLGLPGLEAKYQVLLDAFGEFNVGVERPTGDPFSEGPGFFTLKVRPRRGVRVDTLLARVEDLKLRMGLANDQSVRHAISEGLVAFEFPKGDADGRYPVFAEDVWGRSKPRSDALYAPLGEDALGRVIGIDFSDDTPHLLIGGTTGSGKSKALETILHGLARAYPPDRLRFILVDPKGVELNEFESDPHLLGRIGTDAEDAVNFLQIAVEEMQRRYSLFKKLGAKKLVEYNAKAHEPLPWQVIVLDEYADLTSDKDDRKQIEEPMLRIAQKARAAGIHLIVATQRPTAEIINTTIRSNLPAQLALRVTKALDSRIIMDETGAEALAGKGDALLRTPRGIVRLQCAIRRDQA
jgi:DNA segregation ATPase FtsK/SpoIIIE, S-DNA-T family